MTFPDIAAKPAWTAESRGEGGGGVPFATN